MPRSVRLVQTEPNDPAFAAGKRTDFLDHDLLNAPAVTIKGAGDDAWLLRHACGFGTGEVEHVSRRP
jgi:hypothetical protein